MTYVCGEYQDNENVNESIWHAYVDAYGLFYYQSWCYHVSDNDDGLHGYAHVRVLLPDVCDCAHEFHNKEQ